MLVLLCLRLFDALCFAAKARLRGWSGDDALVSPMFIRCAQFRDHTTASKRLPRSLGHLSLAYLIY